MAPEVRDAVRPEPASREGMFGRGAEREALDLLLSAAQSGSGGSLVLRGEPGIGKTSLLDYATTSAGGLRVLDAAGVESEQGLAFGQARRLFEPLLGRAGELPQREQDSLEAALTDGAATPDFSAARAALALLTLSAGDKPVLCAVDDAQWLDRPSEAALSFVSRRISAVPIVMLFASRESADPQPALEGLPELLLQGLAEEDARTLLTEAVSGPLSGTVRDSLVSAAEGNPLALAGMAAALTGAQLARGVGLPDPLPLGRRLQETFNRRIRRLPDRTQLLLLLIAAEPISDEDLLWRVAEALGLEPDDMAPAEAEGLLAAGATLEFRHPFVRSAVYGAAPIVARRQVHRALAEALDEGADPDRKAWHVAAAATRPDEDLAERLENSAERAKRRGGYAAMAVALERAAELTPDPVARSRRQLSAAWAQLVAGDLEKASGLLAAASVDGSGAGARAERQKLAGALGLAAGDNDQSSTMLRQAAHAFEALDMRLARETHLHALEAAMYAGHLGEPGGVFEAALVARAAPRPAKSKERAVDFLLDGYAARFTEGVAAATPALRRAIEALRRRGELRWLGLACLAAWELWDDAAIHALASRRARLARDTRAFMVLPNGLSQLGGYEIAVGRFDAAEACFDEARRVSLWTGNPGVVGLSDPGGLLLAAWRGQERQARALAENCKREATAQGQGAFVNLAEYVLSVLELSLGRYGPALTAATAARDENSLWSANRALPEVIEAAARTRKPELAAAAVEQLEETATASGTHWGLGILARSRALLATGNDAESLYLDAIAHLKRSRATPDLARAHLLYGEWLRRKRRRVDAREELRRAYEMLASMGAGCFAERARRELTATGERAQPGAATLGALTPHETKIAELVSRGGTNAEIAAQLFVSPRTIEYHLHKIFRKLGISSRNQLTDSLLQSSSP